MISKPISGKILITGGKGRLGSFFALLYPNICIQLGKKELDITDKKSIQKALTKYQPKYILNCAAITSMDYCETYPKECINVNTIGVANLKYLTKKHNIKFIHISSDAAVKPISIYGKSKQRAEKLLSADDLIIRASFFSKDTYIVRELLNGKPVTAYTNLYFNPVSILTLSNYIYRNLDTHGLLNIFSNKRVSKYNFAEIVTKYLGRKSSFVKKILYKNQKGARLKIDSFCKPDYDIDLETGIKKYFNFINT